MPTCVNYRDGAFRLYSSVVDDYITGPLTEEQVLQEYRVTPERVARAKANGCSYIPADLRCVPGKVLVRRGYDLTPENPHEWAFAPEALPEPFCQEPCKHVSCNTVRKQGRDA